MKKLAIIGCGCIGEYHMYHFLQLKAEKLEFEMVGFCDLIEEKAVKFQKMAGGVGKVYTNYVEMLDEAKPDMVFVCIPPYCHGQVEFDLIERGIHFFVEKPLALDLDLARTIRDKAQAAGLITASGFQCRYSNLAEANQQFCKDNEVVFVSCARIGGIPGAEWWCDKELSGGQIAEQTIHQFDMIRYCMGEPEEVFTYGARGFIKREGFNTDDLSTTIIRFKSGALATVSTGCYADNGQSFESKIIFSSKDKRGEHDILNYFRVYEEKPAAEVQSGLILANDGTMKAGEAGMTEYKQDGDAGVPCDRTFIQAVITGDGSKIRSPYADAFKSVSFTLACNQSMATGKPVKVELE